MGTCLVTHHFCFQGSCWWILLACSFDLFVLWDRISAQRVALSTVSISPFAFHRCTIWNVEQSTRKVYSFKTFCLISRIINNRKNVFVYKFPSFLTKNFEFTRLFFFKVIFVSWEDFRGKWVRSLEWNCCVKLRRYFNTQWFFYCIQSTENWNVLAANVDFFSW